MPRPQGAKPPGPPPPPRAKGMVDPTQSIVIIVKSAFTGDSLARLRLTLGTKIRELKRSLERKCGVPEEYQQLVHHTSARELLGPETLDCVIEESCPAQQCRGVVMLVFKRGTEGDSIQRACCEGNRLLVQNMLNAKADANETCTCTGICPLHIAARMARKDIVDALLSALADACIQDNCGRTALHVAASRAVAGSLMDAQADISCMDCMGTRASTNIMPLFALSGDEDAIMYLLQNNAVANALYQTYLVRSEHCCVRGRQHGVLAHVDGNPALHCAVKSGNPEAVALLACVTNLAIPDQDGKSALHLACQTGSTGVFNALLKEMADPMILRKELQPSWLCTGIRSAFLKEVCFAGKPETGYDLRMSCSDLLKMEDQNGDTPLHAASWFGNHAIVSLLLSDRANVHARNHKGRSPLWLATFRCNVTTCKVLLDFGSDVHEQHEGKGLLHMVSNWYFSSKLRDLLIQARADVTMKDNDGHTALELVQIYAERKGGAFRVAAGADDREIWRIS